MELIGENVLMNPKGPSCTVALVTEIMELLFRDHGDFFERFTATTRGLSYMNMMNPEILIAHTLQSPS
jgi:hypothetical protein